MNRRRLHILVALLCTGLWAGAIWLGHTSGHLRFLDRLESALTDVRTLARGVKAPPDLVTIVAIDDTIVNSRHLSAAARRDSQDRRGDRAAGAEGHRDRSSPGRQGPADGDAALAKALGRVPTVLAERRYFRTPFSLPRKTTGRWPACRRPTASCCRSRPLPTARKSASPM
jgi:adenylate cyclase